MPAQRAVLREHKPRRYLSAPVPTKMQACSRLAQADRNGAARADVILWGMMQRA
ncbi:hypothetical protein JCM18899A_19010 [Nocardioides sp. AN3]